MTGIACYYDDEFSVRHAGFATHIDLSPGGVPTRYDLTGNAQGFEVIVDPDPPPPPTSDKLLGVYGGDFSDDTVRTRMGTPLTYPETGTFYWQLGNVNSVPNLGSARSARGIAINHSIAPKDSVSFPTGSRDYMNGLVNGTAFYEDFFIEYLEDVEGSVASAPVGTPQSIVFAMTEPEVQRQQGNLATLEAFMGSTQGCMERVGEYHQAFFDLARIHAPSLLTGIWLGGYSGQYANINFMLSNITGNVDRFGTDPYANSALGANTKPRDTWGGRINAIKTPGGSHYNKWIALGSPPVMLPETGVSTANNSDARIATWISFMREDMIYYDLDRVTWFNSNSGSGGDHEIFQGTFPLSAEAYGDEVRQVI